MDAALKALQDRVRAASARGTPVAIRGGGTKDFYGGALEGDVVDTRTWAGIVDYEPTELVITARCGTPLADIENAMRARGQMLAFEPPHFADGATLGGTVAAGLSGPRRPYAGAVRDLVLGVRVLDGRGEHLAFGGRVMKNVAGFDVARLMTGALGTLGIITEVSLKCLPVPKTEVTRVFECAADQAIRMTNEWGGQPLPLSATCFHEGRLHVRLAGAEPAVTAAVTRLGGDAVDASASFWQAVRDHRHAFFAAAFAVGTPLWRLSVQSTSPHADLGGPQMIEWGGALRWLAAGERTDPVKVRAWAGGHGGHATLFRAERKDGPVFAPLSEPLLALHRKIKAAFDPQGILNRGRLLPDF